tara:strand:- start:75 stop:269 length:195 start_codon:yes stop_codon:yes gene_type:complete
MLEEEVELHTMGERLVQVDQEVGEPLVLVEQLMQVHPVRMVLVVGLVEELISLVLPQVQLVVLE